MKGGAEGADEKTGQLLRPKERITLIARVSDRDAQSFFLDHISIISDRTKIPIKNQYKLKCDNDNATAVPVGSMVFLTGEYEPFLHATNPGEFDAASYYQSLGIIGKLKKIEWHEVRTERVGIKEQLIVLRFFFRERLRRVFPEKEAGIMEAMLLGDKGELDPDLKALYQRNGIVHILSISGLHITLLGMGLYRLLRKMGLPMWAAAIAGGVLLAGYGVMTGMSVSTCRAIGMYLIRMLGVCIGRTYDMQTSLAAVVFLMVWMEPSRLESAGFLLSACSVLGISVLYPKLYSGKNYTQVRVHEEKYWKRVGREWFQTLLQRGREGICAGLSIILATLPIQLWFYYEVPVFSVLLNLLILPFTGLVVFTGLCAMLLPAGTYAGWITSLILSGYESLCRQFDRLPFHTWNPGRPALWQMAVYGVGLLLFVLLSGKRPFAAKRGAGWLRGCWLGLLVLVFAVRFSGEGRIVFLDVGQGDCIFVETGAGEHFLFDCGSSSRTQIGSRVLIPFLKYYGISRLNGVFISHLDADHYNGILELLQKGGEEHLRVAQLFLPDVCVREEAERKKQSELLAVAKQAGQGVLVPVTYLSVGGSYQDAGISISCLHPPKSYEAQDTNGGSLCFYLEFSGGISVLLTGDIQGPGEEALLQQLKENNINHVTVLKVAHHGSANSTSREFLEQISPDYAIISCGKNNRYGHPHVELLERLEQSGSCILSTMEQGAIFFEKNFEPFFMVQKSY